MTPKRQLRDRYPVMLEHCTLSYREGWDNLMALLCERLQFLTAHNNAPQVFITSAKEKYGELRISHHGGDDYQGGMIDMAESISAQICEQCGKPGRVLDGILVRTRCTSCEP